MNQNTLFNFESKKRKINGSLYSKSSDFIVYEINLDKVYNDKSRISNLDAINYTKKNWVICVLVKNKISTFEAISELANFFEIDKKDIGYNGLKDTFGITTQYISIKSKHFLPKLSKLKNKKFKKFFLKNPFFSNKPCKIRNLFGNHFKITIRDYDDKKMACKILNNYKMNNTLPNYYGYQRFGIRQNGHIIGKKLLKKDYESALRIFCVQSKNESKKIINLRKSIDKNWGNWSLCYSLVKNKSSNEEKIFKFLINNPKDFIGALNQTGLTSLLLNSYGSYLYNIILKKLIEKNHNFTRLPLLGYKTKFNHSIIKKEYSKLLKKEKVNLFDFKNNNYKELSWQGREKEGFYKISDINFTIKKDKIILEFNLPMGVYANLFLNNLVKNKLGNKKLE